MSVKVFNLWCCVSSINNEHLTHITRKWFTQASNKKSLTPLQCWACLSGRWFRKSLFPSVRHWLMLSQEPFKAPSRHLADKPMCYILRLYANLPLEKEDLYRMFSSDWLTHSSKKPSSGSSDQLGAVGTVWPRVTWSRSYAGALSRKV